MAIYHCSIKIFSRGGGASAVHKAAYRAAETLASDYDGLIHDYTKKRGVVYKEVLLPENAPDEYADRAVLWNAVEKSERYKTAQLAREIEVSLPVELSRVQNISLARRFVQEQFVNAGMCADICVHDKNDRNPHAHIMLTMRPIEKDGKWGQKSRTVNGRKIPAVDWNDLDKAEVWRSAWADAVNAALENENLSQRVDHRSFSRQGLEQIPTVHLGPAASQMERKGIRTERGNRNREVNNINRQLRQLRARLKRVTDWLEEESNNDTEPNLQDVIHNILYGGGAKTNRQKVRAIQTAADVLAFLQSNHITGMAGLQEKVTAMRRQFDSVRDKLKKTERRLGVLDEHIKQAEIFKEHKAVYLRYQQEQNQKKKAAFYDKHTEGIILYEAAKRYLDAHMNGKSGLPVRAWRAEREKLTAEKNRLYREYTALREDTRKVEQIKRSVEDLLSEELPGLKPERAQGLW